MPLNRMRAAYETFMQQAGVLDSVNAAAHGHSERVSYTNYQRADGIDAAMRLGNFLVLGGGQKASCQCIKRPRFRILVTWHSAMMRTFR